MSARLPRRRLSAGLAALTAGLLAQPALLAAQEEIEITDMIGRRLRLPRPPRRVLLAEANDLFTLSLVHPDPVPLIVGWAAMGRMDKGSVDLYARRFPAIRAIPEIGGWTEDSFSVERAIALRPDLVLMTTFQAPGPGTQRFAEQFAATGIPVAFLTPGMRSGARAHDIAPRLRLFGRIFAREARAESFIAFHQAHLDRIAARLRDIHVRPRVLLENYAGLGPCCRAPARHGWADLIDAAGGINLSAASPSDAGGMLSMEVILARDPEVYVASGGSYLEGQGLVIGPRYDAETTRDGLQRLLARPGFRQLGAVRAGRVHALWTALSVQPVCILAIEAMARWFHPEPFRDLDPGETLAEMNRRFLAVPMEGHYWLSLDPAAAH